MQSNLLTPRQTEKGTLKRASVRTMGCRLNQSEGIALEGKLRQAGYEVVPFGEPAELGVINTCTVTNEADSKSRNAIRRFCQKNPSATTVVVGCYSQISANEVAMVEGVDYVIGNHDKMNFLDYLSEDKPETPVVVRERIDREDFSIGVVGEAQFEQRANLKIQDGCDFMCTFCIIPFARGRARSRDWQDLLMDAKQMIEKGVRELVLTGVNLGTYQSGGRDFLGMINGLSELKGLDRLRISSIEPTTIPEELFPLMADRSHPLMPYLHVPMQAGSDQTLERMKRRYNLAEMDAFFNRATSAVPDLCVGTDLMVGFPGSPILILRRLAIPLLKDPLLTAMYLLIRRGRVPLQQSLVSKYQWMKEEGGVPIYADFQRPKEWIFIYPMRVRRCGYFWKTQKIIATLLIPIIT